MSQTWTAPNNMQEFNSRYPGVLDKLIKLNLDRLYHPEAQDAIQVDVAELFSHFLDSFPSVQEHEVMEMSETSFREWIKAIVASLVKHFLKNLDQEEYVPFTSADVAYLKSIKILAEEG